MKIKIYIATILISVVMLKSFLVLCSAESQYSEENIGKLQTSGEESNINSTMHMKYQSNDLTVSYRTDEADKKENSYYRIKQFRFNKKSRNVTALYKGYDKYGDINTLPIAVYKKQVYCVANNKKRLVIATYNRKMERLADYTFAMNEFVNKKKIKNKHYNFECTEVKVLDKNKVQILYTLNRSGGGCFYGGIAVLNLKTNAISKNKILAFSPIKSDSKYVYGKRRIEGDTLYIAEKETGKVLRSYSGIYGVDTSANYLFSGVEEQSLNYRRHCFDFKDGKIILLNYSGIYYGDVNMSGLKKIMDIEQLPYYVNNLQKRGFYGVALNSEKEFAIAYSDGYEYPNFVFKRYVIK